MPYFESVLTTCGPAQFNGGGTNYLVQTPAGVLYHVYVDTSQDVSFRKSSDNGISWSVSTTVYTGTVAQLCVWYDRWSNIAAGKIHCAYSDSGVDDIFYRSIDTESSDALGTETTVFLGSSTAANGALSITVSRGGNITVAGSIDAGTEDGAWESNDSGATWTGTVADPSEGATGDQYLLLPDFNADNQDIQLIFWDASADALSVKRYDNSANTWTETAIASSMVDGTIATAFPHYDAAVDIANSRVIVVAWSAVDASNADLRCWVITNTTITETTTNVVLNSTDDQGLAAITIDVDTGYWYVFYGGTAAGSETFETSINVYYKVSKDQGTTWGPETRITSENRQTNWLVSCPRINRMPWAIAFFENSTIDHIRCSGPLGYPQSSSLLGV